MSAIEEFVRSATRLPAPPALVVELIRLSNDPDTDLNKIVNLFQSNPALSARLLKLANSVFYGLRGEVTTVNRATVLLGFKTIRSLAVTVWTHSLSTEFQDEHLQSQLSTLFLHSAACAIVGQEIAKKIAPQYQDDVFLAGLLHDFGRLAMVCEMNHGYEQMVRKLHGTDRDLIFNAEFKEYGFNHAELGAKLAETWGFPAFLSDSARNHHKDGLILETQPIPAMVFMADKISNTILENIAPHVKPDSFLAEAWKALGLENPDSIQAFTDHCEEQIKTLLGSMA